MTTRSTMWAHPHPDHTIPAIAAVLESDIDHIVALNVDIYDSLDFKVGIDARKLAARVQLLAGLGSLDPRGGFFGQADLDEALKIAIAKRGLLDKFNRTAATLGKDPTECRSVIAYKLRVMLSHCRIKAEAWRNTGSKQSHPLYLFFLEITEAWGRDYAPLHESRTRSRTPRTRFFVNLQSEPSPPEEPAEEDTDDKVDEATIVSKYFDGYSMKAIRLWSDGSPQVAESYVKGEDGFLEARWNDGDSLSISVVNSCLADDGTVRKYDAPTPKAADPPKPKVALMKKPAAALKSKEVKEVTKKPAGKSKAKAKAKAALAAPVHGDDDDEEEDGAKPSDEDDAEQPADGDDAEQPADGDDAETPADEDAKAEEDKYTRKAECISQALAGVGG